MNEDRWRRIEELYHAARLLKDSARAPFLAAATEGDEELGREVETLLGSTLFYQVRRRTEIFGLWRSVETELHRARPENGPSETIARVSGHRISAVPYILPNVLSPDDQCIATALTDGATTNIWTIATSSGELKPITDFAGRTTVIARSLSWAADNRHIYAAVDETETDVVSLDGLV
jgi:hypothetical protein